MYIEKPTDKELRKVIQIVCKKEARIKGCKHCPYYKTESCEDRLTCTGFYAKDFIIEWERLKVRKYRARARKYHFYPFDRTEKTKRGKQNGRQIQKK